MRVLRKEDVRFARGKWLFEEGIYPNACKDVMDVVPVSVLREVLEDLKFQRIDHSYYGLVVQWEDIVEAFKEGVVLEDKEKKEVSE